MTSTAPKLLPIHRMARTMWRPMLAMGAMALTVGLISSWVWAGEAPGTESARQAAAFTQGVEFLGETMLLSGIAFLLGTIMAGLRSGGGEVQASLGWAIGFTLAIVEAGTGRDQLGDLQTLGNLFPAFMFIGFLGVFSAISFAIARILGVFRRGGGEVQEAAGSEVQTLRMPMTAKAMLLFMMMGMMVMGLGISLNFIAAGSYDGVNPADILDNAQMAAAASGFRRIGVAMYLTGIAFGLGIIIEVLRFQAVRIREVAAEHGHVHS